MPDIVEQTQAPRIEPYAAQPAAPEPAPLPVPPVQSAPEPPRRRSTVREPAPVFAEGAPVAIPIPQPAPAPPPVVVSSAENADDASRPRRTGWWAKRLLSGDKG